MFEVYGKLVLWLYEEFRAIMAWDLEAIKLRRLCEKLLVCILGCRGSYMIRNVA